MPPGRVLADRRRLATAPGLPLPQAQPTCHGTHDARNTRTQPTPHAVDTHREEVAVALHEQSAVIGQARAEVCRRGQTHPELVTLRIDESLYFANARFLEDYIYNRIACDEPIKHVVLMCSAVNEIDMSALESLEAINHRLIDLGIKLHLTEVKGPVMDRLKRSHFLDALSGEVFLAQYDAVVKLTRPHPVAAQ